ncbi:MAG: hypothetical protein ABMA64_37545, partial [Myxococcota bacterium]
FLAGWLEFNATEDSFARSLEEAPYTVEGLPEIAGDGRSGWIVEASSSVERRWRIRVEQVGEHYADCSEGPSPSYTGPVYGDDGVVRLVADERPQGCDGSPDLELRKIGALVEVRWCGETFLARPKWDLAARYQGVLDAWADAKIDALHLDRAGPAKIRWRGAERRCFPAPLMGEKDGGDYLACAPTSPRDRSELVWFDAEGRPNAASEHNMCGWPALWTEGWEERAAAAGQ